MATKTRTPIPEDTAASVQLASGRTCCVCQTPGKPAQIHHIDGDPSNNEEMNLCVLCLICHDDTQTKGGFGRRLNPTLVRQYRDNWHERVRKRRERADEIAISAMAGRIAASLQGEEEERAASVMLVPYIESLPPALSRAYELSRPKWDTGVTVEMVEGTSDVIAVLEQMLIHLAAWYPPRHFEGKPAREYFSAFIASRAVWHRAVAEPGGAGTGGTIVSVAAGGALLADLEQAVCTLVEGLLGYDDSFDRGVWRSAWEKAKERP